MFTFYSIILFSPLKVRRSASIFEEYISSIFKVEEKAKKETSVKHAVQLQSSLFLLDFPNVMF
jgi:hypothetical protein